MDAVIDRPVNLLDLLHFLVDLQLIPDNLRIVLYTVEHFQSAENLLNDDNRSPEFGVLLDLAAEHLGIVQIHSIRGNHIAGLQVGAIKELEGAQTGILGAFAQHGRLDITVGHAGKFRVVLHNAVQAVQVLEQGVIAGQDGVGRQLVPVLKHTAGSIDPGDVHPRPADQNRRDQQQGNKHRHRTCTVVKQFLKEPFHVSPLLSLYP